MSKFFFLYTFVTVCSVKSALTQMSLRGQKCLWSAAGGHNLSAINLHGDFNYIFLRFADSHLLSNRCLGQLHTTLFFVLFSTFPCFLIRQQQKKHCFYLSFPIRAVIVHAVRALCFCRIVISCFLRKRRKLVKLQLMIELW